MKRTLWLDRHFPSAPDPGLLPAILERLEGTPARLESKLKNISEDLLTLKISGKWSIKDEVGHLGDLEALSAGRVEELAVGATELMAADMSNKKTHEAGHNNTSLADLLQYFRGQREALVKRIRTLSDEQLRHSALHPRLKVPMRVVDLALFFAEHDDHHLAAIQEILSHDK